MVMSFFCVYEYRGLKPQQSSLISGAFLLLDGAYVRGVFPKINVQIFSFRNEQHYLIRDELFEVAK